LWEFLSLDILLGLPLPTSKMNILMVRAPTSLYGQRAMDSVRHYYIQEAVASGWKKLYTWDIVGGHAEIIHTERMLMHLMGDIEN
ncbi:hypothetical protein ACJX0J_020800, partial [Zea mays]